MPNTSSYIFDTLNNKFPCEGPRVVQCVCDFTSASSFDVDLKSLVTQGKISEVQSVFVDNADNSLPLFLRMSGNGQRIIIPPYSQAYIAVLLNQAQFTVTTGNSLVINIYAQNFPVNNCVWSAPSNGSSATNVNVANWPISQQVFFTPTISNAFLPSGTGINLTTGAASASTAIASVAGQNIRVMNTGTFPVSFRWGMGAQTAVVTDLTLAPNQSILVNSNGANTLAAISPGGAGSINIVVGNGGLSA